MSRIRVMDASMNSNGHAYSRECILAMSAKMSGIRFPLNRETRWAKLEI